MSIYSGYVKRKIAEVEIRYCRLLMLLVLNEVKWQSRKDQHNDKETRSGSDLWSLRQHTCHSQQKRQKKQQQQKQMAEKKANGIVEQTGRKQLHSTSQWVV